MKNWICTSTGKKVFVESNLGGFHVSGDISLDDIANGLALECRFGRQCRKFYSVARHSLILCDLFAAGVLTSPKWSKLELMKWALLHDAAEAYTGDVPRPLKNIIPDLVGLESAFLVLIAEKFDLPTVLPDIYPKIVAKLDHALMHYEGSILMPPAYKETQSADKWEYELTLLGEAVPDLEQYFEDDPDQVKDLFLRRCQQLGLRDF